MNAKTWIVMLATAVLALGGGAQVRAGNITITNTWDGGGSDNDWSTTENWSDVIDKSSTPWAAGTDGTDDVCTDFENDGTNKYRHSGRIPGGFTVNVTGDEKARDITVGTDGAATLNISSGVLSSNAGALVVNNGSTLNVTGGTLNSQRDLELRGDSTLAVSGSAAVRGTHTSAGFNGIEGNVVITGSSVDWNVATESAANPFAVKDTDFTFTADVSGISTLFVEAYSLDPSKTNTVTLDLGAMALDGTESFVLFDALSGVDDTKQFDTVTVNNGGGFAWAAVYDEDNQEIRVEVPEPATLALLGLGGIGLLMRRRRG